MQQLSSRPRVTPAIGSGGGGGPVVVGNGAVRPRSSSSSARRQVPCRASPSPKQQQQQLARVPADYVQAVRQIQDGVKAAIADGLKLIEVEVPSLSLTAAQGDGEGMNEMNAAMDLLRRSLVAFQDRASATRVFFPDAQELAVARSGQTMDPNAGRAALEAKFEENTKFKFGVLTKQNALWSTIGVNLFGAAFDPAAVVRSEDELLFIAYPSFNPREELSATAALYERVGGGSGPDGRPIVVFNGELDRVRGGYYPAFAFGELAKLRKDFIPQFEAAFYLRNFKGTTPGVLFRQHPGPWQVLRRNPLDDGDLRVVWTGDARPSLKEVAMEILPGAGRR